MTIYNVICSKCCTALVPIEVSIGTHRVRVLSKDSTCKLKILPDSDGIVWVETVCTKCSAKESQGN